MGDKINKLSVAMRLGCLVKPQQSRTHLFSGETEACALGAVLAGLGWDGNECNHAEGYAYLEERFPELLTFFPVDGQGYALKGEIIRNNDRGGWSREQIADWLESYGL